MRPGSEEENRRRGLETGAPTRRLAPFQRNYESCVWERGSGDRRQEREEEQRKREIEELVEAEGGLRGLEEKKKKGGKKNRSHLWYDG